MAIGEWGYREKERNYNLNLDQKDIKSIKQEFDRVFRKFNKETIHIDSINFNFDIRYHDLDLDDIDEVY